MKLAIVGDEHLGFRQYNLDERERDFLIAFSDVISKCKKLGIDTIALTGDLFNNARPSGGLVFTVSEMLVDFKHKYGIDGNHDIADNAWLKLCRVDPIDKRIVALDNGCTLAGMNWVRPAVFIDELKAFLSRHADARPPITIFVLHQLLDEFLSFKFMQISGKEIAKLLKPFGTKFVVLSDLHETKEVTIDGITFLTTGATELNSISEQKDKSFVVIDTKTLTYSRVPIKTRPVMHKYITDEAQLADLIAEVKKVTKPLLILEYDHANRELLRTTDLKLKDLALCRLVPRNISAQKNQSITISDNKFDRSEAMQLLKQSILAYFKEDTDEFQLIHSCLTAPDSIEDVIDEFRKKKGL